MAKTAVLAIDRLPAMAKFNSIVKTALVLSFVIAIFFPLDGLEGKAMGSRAPLSAHGRRDAVLLGYGFGAIASSIRRNMGRASTNNEPTAHPEMT